MVRSLAMRGVRADARECDFICSTDAIDSYEEVVEQSWRLERYRRNPVVLWAHQSRELPIGAARNVAVVEGKLQATIVFSKATQLAQDVWTAVTEGMLRAVSVGFYPNTIRSEKRGDRDVVVLADNELLEISVTPIPANPECVAKLRERAMGLATEHSRTDLDADLALVAAIKADIEKERAEENRRWNEFIEMASVAGVLR